MAGQRRRHKEALRNYMLCAQKKAEARNRMCGEKKRYDTEIEAWSAGKFAFRDGRYVGTYFCPHCSKWHITTRRRVNTA